MAHQKRHLASDPPHAGGSLSTVRAHVRKYARWSPAILTRVHGVNWYRIKTSLVGFKRLVTLPEEDKQACIDAYKFFQRMQAGEETKTENETKAVADYYKVLNNMLSIFDVEKLYIPHGM